MIGDPNPDAVPAEDGEDGVVAPPGTTLESEGRGDSEDATEYTMEIVTPIGNDQAIEENLEPPVEDGEEEERGIRGEGAPDLGGGGKRTI